MGVYDLERIELPDSPPEYEDHAAEPHFVPAPCQVACPVGTDAPSYIAYIWEQKWKEAFEAITSTNPFSSICGRVCDAPCEPACRRTESDGPLMIRNLKRYVMERVGKSYDPPPIEVTKEKRVAIIGAGPAGLTAAHDLCVAGYEVHVYEMSDRLGGMMVWGIPTFRLPTHVIREDIERITRQCRGLKIFLNKELGKDISLDQLKKSYDATLLTIGAWWGKSMSIPGEDDSRVVDGVSFLRKINDGERPKMPETVIVIGGGDVSMDACRAALRLPNCKTVKVIYRRGPDQIPARKIELEGALKEGVEVIYNTQQLKIIKKEGGIAIRCVKTSLGDLDLEGRKKPILIPNTEHDIDCGLVIAAVGQKTVCSELDQHGLMLPDRVRATYNNMQTSDPKIFAAGDGAFGGSTIVVAMNHGQRAAYYINAFLEGRKNPLPYRTPYRSRRVPVAQDMMWERLPMHEPIFHGLGKTPVTFPEIESTYTDKTAKDEAARCYRCDAETGSNDYSVEHREDLFSMARTNPLDHRKHHAMLKKRLRNRDNPFPKNRKATLDDLVFLPANLSRLVIDPYREACKVSSNIANKVELDVPFLIAGFDDSPDEIREALAIGINQCKSYYLGRKAISASTKWFQLAFEGDQLEESATGIIHVFTENCREVSTIPLTNDQLIGFCISNSSPIEDIIAYAIEKKVDFLLLDGTKNISSPWPELHGNPNLRIVRDVVAHLRRIKKEELIDLIWFGGMRSGTDTAKLIALGCKAVILSTQVGLALGGEITSNSNLSFSAGQTIEDRSNSVVNIVNASVSEASMMARCTGKTILHNLEPEDMRSITIASSIETGIPLAGTDNTGDT